LPPKNIPCIQDVLLSLLSLFEAHTHTYLVPKKNVLFTNQTTNTSTGVVPVFLPPPQRKKLVATNPILQQNTYDLMESGIYTPEI